LRLPDHLKKAFTKLPKIYLSFESVTSRFAPTASENRNASVSGRKAIEMTKKTRALTQIPDPEGVTRAIDNAIGKIQAQLESDEVKASVGDLVRLIQLRNELADEHPVDITARWID
jgi:hypothetical protein